MKTLKIILTTILILLSSTAFSHDLKTEDTTHLNCELCPKTECPKAACEADAEEKKDWKNNFSLGYNKTDGNSDTSLLNVKISSIYDKDDDQISLSAEHSFGENDDETNVDYSKGVAEYKHIMTKKWFAGMGTTYLRDEIADVKYRLTLNPAIGYYVFKSDLGFFAVDAGPSYLFEEVDDESDDYLAPRIGDRFEYQITDTAKVFQIADIIFSADDSDNYLIQAEAGIETKISESMSLVFKVRDNYDNQPAEGNKRNDMALLTAIGVDF